MKKLVLFDLDNTLLEGDSDYFWAQHLIEEGVLDLSDPIGKYVPGMPNGDTATIQQFEEAIGLKLFDRTTRRVVMTEDARRFHAEAESMDFEVNKDELDTAVARPSKAGASVRSGSAGSTTMLDRP